VTGQGGLAGEFGHVTLDPAGPLCGCGRKGCWEMYASTRATLQYYGELSGGGGPPITARRLLNLADEGDPAAVAALTRQAEYLARGLHVITSALSPEAILFTGEITSAWERFCPVIEEQLRKELLAGAPPRLLTTMNSQFARLRGAAALVLQRHSGYHRTHQAGAGNGKSKTLAYA
jgi:predicted NBD/HSP70 family sugar kinase